MNAGVDAYDPHVNGDTVAYTADSTIRYYSFFTGSDTGLPPGAGSSDLLSDVDGTRIVFTRVDGTGARVMLFDTLASTMAAISPAGATHFGAAIGNNTVALIDQFTGVLQVAMIGSAAVAVTDGSRIDQRPQVSPSGDRIVYESCPTSDPINCDIHQATWNGASFVTSAVTSTTLGESNADSDGNIIVYDATRADAGDVCWISVGGGTESCLELSGEQRNPSVSAGVIVFESGAPADIYVYETSSNRLYQLTSTPADDSLNDVYVTPAGSVRVVWASQPAANRDVYGADLVLPPVGPTYSFGGFLQPVDARPTLNSLKAGAAVPVKFSLGGYQGLNVFQAGYPKSQSTTCDSSADVDGIESTIAAGGSSLTYDPVADVYTHVWKTDMAWAGTCRQLVLGFSDGSIQRANFKFK